MLIPESVVILGGGQGGFQTAASLRQEGFAGDITLVEAEDGLPYQRPPLSKAYIQGKVGGQGLLFRQQKFFEDNRITLLRSRAAGVDRASRRVILADGCELDYGHLVISVGARARKLSVPGADIAGVFELRNLADADAIKPWLQVAHNVVVIGAGFVGLEFSSVARASGAAVHVVEMAARPMARAVSQQTSGFLADAHARRGISFNVGVGLEKIHGMAGKVSAVELADGTRLPADLVMVGIGVVPNVGLAEEAGLAIENGIKVDAHLLTSDAAISAIGDCASFPSAHSGARIRLESVQNAGDQGRVVAARLAGRPAPYAALPWFWSDQGDLKLQMAGLFDGQAEAVVTGNPGEDGFSVLLFKGRRLVAVECLNRPGDFMAGRKLLSRPHALRPDHASCSGFSLRHWEAGNREASV